MNKLQSGLQVVIGLPVPWPAIFVFPFITQLASSLSLNSRLPVVALDCTLTTLLPHIPVPCCLAVNWPRLVYWLCLCLMLLHLAVDDLLACILVSFLFADQVKPCSRLWSLSLDPQASISCKQQLALPASTPLMPLCVLTPVVATKGVWQELQEKAPLQLNLHQVHDISTAANKAQIRFD